MGVRHAVLIAALASLHPATTAAQEASFSSARLTSAGAFDSSTHGGDREGLLYQAGSISKFACTVAVLRLADQNALTLQSRLGDLVPSMRGTPGEDVPLRHILANRSGLPDGLLPSLAADPALSDAQLSAAEAVRRFANAELQFDSDGQWSYDLVNWIAVQAVIEHATGEPLSTALRQLVYEPAGMGASRIFNGQLGAVGQEPIEPARGMPPFLECAGGTATRPADLIALARFAARGGLSTRSLAALDSVTTPEENYTLGGRIHELEGDGRVVRWLTGSNGPFKSVLVYDRQSDTGFAAMTAQGDWAAIETARDEWLAQLTAGE